MTIDQNRNTAEFDKRETRLAAVLLGREEKAFYFRFHLYCCRMRITGTSGSDGGRTGVLWLFAWET